LVIRHMSGIIADGTSGIVNIVLFRALEGIFSAETFFLAKRLDKTKGR